MQEIKPNKIIGVVLSVLCPRCDGNRVVKGGTQDWVTCTNCTNGIVQETMSIGLFMHMIKEELK